MTATAAYQREAAATVGLRLLTGAARARPAVVGALLSALHAPLLLHPKAAVRKALLELAAGATAEPEGGVAAGGAATGGAFQAGAALLACLAGDRDATVRAKALALLAAAAPTLVRGLAAPYDGSDGVGAGSGVSAAVRCAAVERLMDSSKTVRRGALQLLSALVVEAKASGAAPAAPQAAAEARGGEVAEAAGAAAGGVSALLAAAIGPLLALADTPPASPAHDEACQAAAVQLLQELPGQLGMSAVLRLVVSCGSGTAALVLLDGLLTPQAGPARNSTRGHARSNGGGGAGRGEGLAYSEWEHELARMRPEDALLLRDLCAQLAAGEGHGGQAGHAAGARAALERLRRHGYAAVSAALGGLSGASIDVGGGPAAAPPAVGRGPAAGAVRRLAAAARVIAVSGGLGGEEAAAGDALGEAAILGDVLEALLPPRQLASAGAKAAAAAAVGRASAAEAASTGAMAAAGGASEAELQEGGGLACEDGIYWALQAAAVAAEGPPRPGLAPVLRWPLLAHLDALLGCPLSCVDLGMQALLASLEAAALAPWSPAPDESTVSNGAEAAPHEPPLRLRQLQPHHQQHQHQQQQQPRALAAYLILLRHLSARYSHAAAAFKAQLAAGRTAAVAAGQIAAAAGGPAQHPQDDAAAGGGCGYLEAEAQLRADEDAAALYLDSLLEDGTAPASRLPLLAAVAGDEGAPDYARVLSLQALQDFLLLSDRLADDLAPTALAPLLAAPPGSSSAGAAPAALLLQAARGAGALVARRPRAAPAALAALERAILSQLERRRGGGGGGGGAGARAGAPNEGASPPAECGAGGAAGTAARPDEPPSLAAAAAAAYAGAVAGDSLVMSSSSYAAISACLMAEDEQVALIAAALSRDLLRTAPPHQRRKLLLGLLAHAPASAGAALARGPVAALLRDAPGGGGEELALALVQALAGATAACGGAPAGGDEGAEDPEGAGGGGGGASGRAACRAQLAEAAAAMLEHVAPGPRSLGALLAHLQWS
ncbi:hypothetical protein MNEG_9478 [Monoraphidium neglectum]|uniref:Uncharacterized protein n=1 Tax=Monoraphidium neglectum TaxID=145388 RepID=A0A0D2M4K6_9CHLO|nr:hypothetical protein MNEG_9478 [Monoraphidium neglectum]KIY98484.1 hypothetical protein MNEG_9478 [Monoraphidium neglectum]|eukprot:XP_013897504.1 hypothetical protein MNEG_9478 [Monoraphidium neglectum]